MKLLRPITMTDGMLVSSTVAEDDYAAWSDATTYAVGDRCIVGHKVWESLQAGNLNHDPTTDASDPPYWLEVSSTNRWRMFDQTVNSATTAADSIVVELQPGAINAVGLIELLGSTVTVELLDGSTVVYSETKDIDQTPVADWYAYFFEPYQWATAVLFEDVPSYLTGTVRITISGTGTVECGGVVVGQIYSVGDTLVGVTAGIVDYSRKSTNDFGVTSIVQRAYAKRASAKLILSNTDLARVHALLASVRATPCLWVGDDDTQTYAPLVIFGWYRDFQIDIAYRTTSYCNLEIEGMI